jgi:hypothetical protein
MTEKAGTCIICGAPTSVTAGRMTRQGIRWNTHRCARCGRTNRVQERVTGTPRMGDTKRST